MGKFTQPLGDLNTYEKIEPITWNQLPILYNGTIRSVAIMIKWLFKYEYY